MCSSSQAQTNVKKWGEGNYVIMVVAEGGRRWQKGRSTVCMCSSSQAQTNVKKWGEGNYVIMVVAEGGRGVGKRREESLSL